MVRTLIDIGAGLVIHEAEGPLSLDEIQSELQATLANPAFSPGMKTVWDLRGASIAALTERAVRSLVDFNLVRKEQRGGGRAAIVASQDVDYGVARMFQAYAEELPWETMVFRGLDDALPWLHGITEHRQADVIRGRESDAEPMCGRVCVDPDRGLEWRAAVGLDFDGRFCPVYTRLGIRLWGSEEVTVDIERISEVQLREHWRSGRREFWYDRERWWVRWEDRPSQETWTWFESAAGARRAIKDQYPFPYVSESELADALEMAEWVE